MQVGAGGDAAELVGGGVVVAEPVAGAVEELPEAVAVMDPFHVVRLAGNALDGCRRRVQQQLHGHRGRAGDPLYAARRTLHTGAAFRTPRQQQRLDALFADERHAAVEVAWGIYQRMVAAYRESDRAAGKQRMVELIDTVGAGVPAALREVITLGRTLKQRAADVLAYFDRPGTSNGQSLTRYGPPAGCSNGVHDLGRAVL